MSRITPIDTPEARSVIHRLCAGSTSRSSDYAVLWLGEHLAIVKWKGASGYGIHGRVTLRPRRKIAYEVKRYLLVKRQTLAQEHGHDVGLLTQALLDGYIADAECRDRGWLVEEEAGRKAQLKRQARQQKSYDLEDAVRVARKALLNMAKESGLVYAWGGALIETALAYREALAALDAHQKEVKGG